MAPKLDPSTRIVNGRLSQCGDSFRVRRRTGHERHAVFECQCGVRLIIATNMVRRGNSTSCGCFKKEILPTIRYSHGHAKKSGHSRTYQSWLSMRQRCSLGEDDRRWEYYAGKGIKVCREWEESFEAFLLDMGQRPPGRTIDRIDSEKGYSKDNCRWASSKEQQRNKRSNSVVEFNGRVQCLSDWAEEYGIRLHTLRQRLITGWSVEKALTHPIRKRKK